MSKYKRSPLAPESFPSLPVIGGVRFATAEAGVKYPGRRDVMLALLDPGSVLAGVFTRSATRSANVLDCQAKIGADSPEGAAIIVNSGNSNAFTGRAGTGSVTAICDSVAQIAGLPASRVFTSSTGVIGERLPHERITAKIDELAGALSSGALEEAAQAIMTTDTFPKGACAEVTVDDDGMLKMHRIVAATDPGMVVNPQQVQAQLARPRSVLPAWA